jgi:hypothetical protein
MMRLLLHLALLALILRPASDLFAAEPVATTVQVPAAADLAAIIKLLDDDDYSTRENASSRLADLPGEALPELEKAVKAAALSAEGQARSEEALQRLRWKIEPKMIFNFDAVSMDTILAEMSRKFGIVFVQSFDIQNPITVQISHPLNAEDSLKLLNNLLYPLGYVGLATSTADGTRVIHITPYFGKRHMSIPVYKGNDSGDIGGIK